MKKLLSLVLLAVLAASVAYAENFTQKNTDKAKAIIDAAVEARDGSTAADLETALNQEEFQARR